jgi:hypothetical protein
VEILNVRRATLSDLVHGKAAVTLDVAIRSTWRRIADGVDRTKQKKGRAANPKVRRAPAMACSLPIIVPAALSPINLPSHIHNCW